LESFVSIERIESDAAFGGGSAEEMGERHAHLHQKERNSGSRKWVRVYCKPQKRDSYAWSENAPVCKVEAAQRTSGAGHLAGTTGPSLEMGRRGAPTAKRAGVEKGRKKVWGNKD